MDNNSGVSLDEYLSAPAKIPTFVSVDVFSDIGATKGYCFRLGTAKTLDELAVLIKNNIKGAKTYNDSYAMLSLMFHFDNCVGTVDFEQNENGFTHVLSVFVNQYNTSLITQFVNSVV